MNRRKLIAAIVEKTGIKLDEDDPAFVLVELNRLTLEASGTEIVESIAAVSDNFNKIATRNVDDFVDVANEALSKFIMRTNEIKVALDDLKRTKETIEAKPATDIAEKNEPQSGRLMWLSGTFIAGILAGVLISSIVRML